MSKYVVSVESSSLIHQSFIRDLFVSCLGLDGLENLHADKVFQTNVETKGEG